MKRHNTVTYVAFGCIAAILLLTVILSGAKVSGKENGTSSGDRISSELVSSELDMNSEPIPVADHPSSYYIIKSFGGGKIGVFENESENPKFVISEIALMALPVLDRELLKEGITVYSDEDLYALIEDLDS